MVVESEEDEQQEEEVVNGRIVKNGIVDAPPVKEEGATDNNIAAEVPSSNLSIQPPSVLSVASQQQ